MMIRSALLCASLLAFSTLTWAADKPAPKTAVKPAAKATPKPARKVASKPTPTRVVKLTPKTTAKGPQTLHTTLRPAFKPRALVGKTETLTCRDGTEDRHARIGVVLIGGKVDSFAYYSKWKPRTCSIYLQRNRDSYSKWFDKGPVTNVNLERGLFLIEHKKNEYHFVFRDIDRERFCGMDGTINGILKVRKGTERCEHSGIMEEGVPLGQAHAHLHTGVSPGQAHAYLEPTVLPAAPASAPAEPAPSSPATQRTTRRTESVFPSASVGISD